MTESLIDKTSIQYAVLDALEGDVLPLTEIHDAVADMTQLTPLDFGEAVLVEMMTSGLIEIDNFGMFTVSSQGLMELKLARGVAPIVKANLYQAPTGVYDGRELGETCTRPGAYDFKKHPSLIAGNRHHGV